MNISRRGKIARLPEEIRRQLNQRLRNGEAGAKLVPWLNSLPEVQTIITDEFEGKPVREQNLSQWRQGGYAAWLEQQEALEMAAPVAADLQDLAESAGGPVTDQMAIWLTARYLLATQNLDTAHASNELRWERLREFCSDLVALRRGDHYSERLKLDREKFGAFHKGAPTPVLELCLKEAGKYPEVMESFRASFKLLRERMAKEPPPPNPGLNRNSFLNHEIHE